MLTVGTLNVYGLPPARSPVGPLRQRIDELGQRLDAGAIDVLNLQEVWFWHQLVWLRQRLRSFPHMASRPGWNGAGPAGALVTFARRPLRSARFRSFRGLASVRGGGPRVGGPRVGRPLSPTRDRLEAINKGFLVVDADGLTIVNAHLPATDQLEFQRAALLRLNTVLADRVPLILTGDLNIASDSSLYPLIVDHGARRDFFARADEPTFPSAKPSRRIDYLLTAGELAVTAGERLFPGLLLSDHFGLVAQIGRS